MYMRYRGGGIGHIKLKVDDPISEEEFPATEDDDTNMVTNPVSDSDLDSDSDSEIGSVDDEDTSSGSDSDSDSDLDLDLDSDLEETAEDRVRQTQDLMGYTSL